MKNNLTSFDFDLPVCLINFTVTIADSTLKLNTRGMNASPVVAVRDQSN